MAESYISELGDKLSHGVENTDGSRVKIIAPKLYTDGNSHPSIATAFAGKAASSHTHGNIQNGGTLQTTDVTIANGDKLVVTDSSDSNKIARASVSFDGSTTGTLLSKKGTWENPKEAYLEWGGRNFMQSFGPLDAALVSELGANRFACGKAAGITIEYTRDGGTTWVDYGASDLAKCNIFTNSSSHIEVGKADSTNKATTAENYANYKVRVIINCGTFGIYNSFNKFVFYVSTNGSNHCYMKMSGVKQAETSDVWTAIGEMQVNGWSGFNVYNQNVSMGASSYATYKKICFLFECRAAGNTTYNGLSILSIFGYGGVGWHTPSTLASTGHVYTVNGNQEVTFPSTVTATSFAGPLTGDVAGTATKSNYPTGFGLKPSSITWGTLTSANGYTYVTNWRTASAAEIAFAEKSGALYTQIDGVFYQREGGKRVLDVSDINSSFYAPTGAGNSGQILKSSGSGAPTWATANAALVGITVTSTSVSDGTNTFNKYTHPTTSGNKHVPSGGSSGQFLGWDSDGTAKWVANPNTDTKVKATAKTDNVNYKILATASASPTSGNATEAVYDTDITLNPSTNTISANVSGNAATATTATKLGSSTLGSGTKPIYLSSGTATECSTYAGGTAVTLNNASKAASTASFYAPTGAGTSGQLLKSSGSGAPTWATANAALVGITVTSTSVSDGTNTFNKYTHPTTAGNKHVPSGGATGNILGWDSAGTAKWISPSASTVGITVTSTSVSDGTNTFNKYTHPTTSGNKHVPSGGSSGQILGWDSDGTAKWVANTSSHADTATHLNAYGEWYTWASGEYDSTKPYVKIAEKSWPLSGNKGAGQQFQIEYNNTYFVRVRLNFRMEGSNGFTVHEVLVIDSNITRAELEDRIRFNYFTYDSGANACIHIYVKFTGLWQNWRVRQLDAQSGDNGHENWVPFDFYNGRGVGIATPQGTQAEYVYPIDNALSTTSEKPVQNKVVTAAIAAKADQAGNYPNMGVGYAGNVIPKEYNATSSGVWVEVGTFKSSNADAMYSGITFEIKVRDSDAKSQSGFLWISAGEYKSPATYSNDDIVCEYYTLGRRQNALMPNIKLYVNLLGSSVTAGVKIYAYLSSWCNIWLTAHNVSKGDYTPSMTAVSEPATKKEVAYRNLLRSNYGTAIGSTSTPVYVDSNGSVRACGSLQASTSLQTSVRNGTYGTTGYYETFAGYDGSNAKVAVADRYNNTNRGTEITPGGVTTTGSVVVGGNIVCNGTLAATNVGQYLITYVPNGTISSSDWTNIKNAYQNGKQVMCIVGGQIYNSANKYEKRVLLDYVVTNSNNAILKFVFTTVFDAMLIGAEGIGYVTSYTLSSSGWSISGGYPAIATAAVTAQNAIKWDGHGLSLNAIDQTPGTISLV
jgi:hypothetical protein